MNQRIIVEPGDPAPIDGTYEAVDSLGRESGIHIVVRKGEHLPGTIHGHKWRLQSPIGETPDTESQS